MIKRLLSTALLLASLGSGALAQTEIDYSASTCLSASTGEFAPLYISSLRHGIVSSKYTALARGTVSKAMTTESRFSWGFGLSLIGGGVSGHSWERYNPEPGAVPAWYTHREHPARAWIQQLYAEAKWRGVFATVGLKEHNSALLDSRLTSGDLVESGNSRPIPEVRVGFIDFQNIPFTNGWVQIQGEIGYGYMTDGDWWENRHNRYNWHYNTGQMYNYKRCYFRTRPSERFSVTVGMQAADIFGGTFYKYREGVLVQREKHTVNSSTIFHALLPIRNNSKEGFYEGNHLGSWDFVARYRLDGGHALRAYFQWPWEDGSGIGRRNGWDGLWGLEWTCESQNYPRLEGATIEYLDFTNQSGPIHYAPGDVPGESIGSEATGADDYYNNAFYNAYAHYGLSIGSPMMMAPAYNLDGYMAYTGNRMRGVHAALTGAVIPGLQCTLKGSWRRAYGNAHIMFPEPKDCTALGASAAWSPQRVPGLGVTLDVAYDHGSLPGNSFGVMATISYSGSFRFKK